MEEGASMRATPCCIGETRWRGCGLFAGDAPSSTITRVRAKVGNRDGWAEGGVVRRGSCYEARLTATSGTISVAVAHDHRTRAPYPTRAMRAQRSRAQSDPSTVPHTAGACYGYRGARSIVTLTVVGMFARGGSQSSAEVSGKKKPPRRGRRRVNCRWLRGRATALICSW
jgi:hypothetical protein